MIVKTYTPEVFSKDISTERPHNLTNVTLADWAAWYDSYGKPYRKKTRKFDADSLLQEHCID